MITQVNEYRLQIKGIFGRNRKVKFETFPLTEIPIDQTADEADIRRLAQAKIAEVRVKSGSVKVTKTPITIEKGEFFISRSHMISLLADNTFIDLGVISP